MTTARDIIDSIELKATLADGHFTPHQVKNLMLEAARAGLRGGVNVSSTELVRFTTETGCTIITVPHAQTGDHILTLRMEQDGDGRSASVMLTPLERAQLRAALGSNEEAARHDMPADLYSDLCEHLLLAAEYSRGPILLLGRLKEHYGASTRKKFGLD